MRDDTFNLADPSFKSKRRLNFYANFTHLTAKNWNKREQTGTMVAYLNL